MLKQLIQRLLDSRTTPSEAGHSAMPGSVHTTLLSNASVSDWGTVSTGTAADDGYLVLTAKNGGNEGASLSLNVNGVARQSLTYPFAGAGGNAFTPIAKGSTWALIGSSSTEITLKLFKTIGGGYNLLVRRALPCLRPSFNYLPRSFCKAKNLGFQNNQLLLSIRALIFLAQAPRISLPTPHRATAGRLLGAIQLQSQLLKSKSRTGRWHLLPYLTETLRELESVVTLKKGHRLSSCAVAEVQPIIFFGSTKPVQTFNPLTGGALC